MAVDLNTPLTNEERAYLAMRGRISEMERADSMTGVQTPDYEPGDGTGPMVTPLMTSEQRADRKAALQRELELIEEAEGSDEGRDGSVEDGDVDPYEVWSPDELTKELKRRELPHTGSKADKAARLYEDDANVKDPEPES
jgi:hypothetical protein